MKGFMLQSVLIDTLTWIRAKVHKNISFFNIFCVNYTFVPKVYIIECLGSPSVYFLRVIKWANTYVKEIVSSHELIYIKQWKNNQNFNHMSLDIHLYIENFINSFIPWFNFSPLNVTKSLDVFETQEDNLHKNIICYSYITIISICVFSVVATVKTLFNLTRGW